MSTDMTVTFTTGTGQVIRFAPVTDAEDTQDGTTSVGGRAGDHRVRHQRQAHPDPRRNRQP